MPLIHKLFLGASLIASTCLSAQVNYPDWKPVGSATLTVLWFDIYQAELSSETGTYVSDRSYKLTLTYLRDFDAEDLIEETFKQMPGPLTEKQTSDWHKQLTALWPNVKKQESISFLKDEKGYSHFYHNRKYLGAIKDTQFSQQFSAIWLASTSEYPKLAAQLKGHTP